ncbi:hypothetical protein GCM10010406_51050 [Streptomyces thermolineatus]|uniref:Uncharacterized protein n=1 Tax=Streptomyces thermolineatus TaxID=44033 RepID=A0ABN3MUE2_9ACTN
MGPQLAQVQAALPRSERFSGPFSDDAQVVADCRRPRFGPGRIEGTPATGRTGTAEGKKPSQVASRGESGRLCQT